MPDNTAMQPAEIQDNGLVRIKSDAQLSSALTQPVSSPGQVISSQAAPTAPPPFMPPIFGPLPQPAEQMAQIVQTAANKEQQAKHEIQAALQTVKLSEEEARASQEKLRQQVVQAQTQVSQAQSQIKEAKQQQEESQKQLKEVKQNNGFNIAGYKPGDIAQAITKPPQPGMSSPGPELDKATQQRLEAGVNEIKQQVTQTEQQIKAADKQIGTAQKNAEKTKKQHDTVIEKIASVLQKLVAGKNDSQPRASSRPHNAFMILGVVFMALALVTLLIAKSYVWVFIAIAAIVQLGMGTILKRQSS